MYDTVIIGRDLSSVVAALASLRNGKRTALINESREEDYREANYTFSIHSAPCLGLATERGGVRLLKNLHPSPDAAPRLLQPDPAFQIILTGHRIDLFGDYQTMVDDMIREFPRSAPAIRQFYQAVAKTGGLVERWIREDESGQVPFPGSMSRWLLRLPGAIAGRSSMAILRKMGEEAFKKTIAAQVAVLANLDVDGAPLPLSTAYPLSLPFKGVFYPVGGKNAWIKWLKKGFVEAGGVILDDCSVIRVDTNPNIHIDLESSGVPATLRSHNLIVSTQWEKLNLLLGEQRALRRLKHRFVSRQPVAYPFCIHLGVREDGLPERMAPLTVLLPDESKPLIDRNLLFVETSLPGEEGRAPEGRRAVSVTTYIAESPLKLTDLELKGLATDAIDSLEAFLPFLRENIDYINIEKIIAVSRQCQDVANLKYRPRRGLLSGVKGLSPKTPLPNVFLTGAMLRTDLGFEGEILSGLDAAVLAAGKDGPGAGQLDKEEEA